MKTMDTLESKEIHDLTLIQTFKSYAEQEELILVPDNYAEIIIPIFNEDIGIRIIGTTKYLSLNRSSAYFLSPRRRGMEVVFEPNAQFILLKINPVYSRIISQGLVEVANGIFDCAISGTALRNLKLALAFEDRDATVQWLNAYLLTAAKDFEINRTVEESILRIKDRSGAIKVKELYTDLNVSKSKLEKNFNAELGMTPKEFCKIEKINHFIRTYQEGYGQNLTELTYKCGYYDQSHLIKDFRYFLDLSPKQFFSISSDYLQ